MSITIFQISHFHHGEIFEYGWHKRCRVRHLSSVDLPQDTYEAIWTNNGGDILSGNNIVFNWVALLEKNMD